MVQNWSLMSEPLLIPELLDGPVKLKAIIDNFNSYRYFLSEGGRGGGKSQFIARFLLYLGEQNNVRIVCGREIQKNITESVHSIMADLIRQYNLNYEIFTTKIVHKKSQTQINFRGFREQGAFNIQGMEGVDIVWIDEAQAITKATLDVLIPTIRKDNAKVFFSMNRHVADDPVFDMFAQRSDCLHINLNFYDNPFCTEALKHEAEECKKKSAAQATEDYNHIWLGKPLSKSEDAVFTYTEMEEAKINKRELNPGYGYRVGGFDVARYGDDKCACVGLQQMGALHWEEFYVDQWGQKDLNYTTGRILTTITEQELCQSIIDEDGIGSGPLDTLQKGRSMESVVGFRNPSIGYGDNQEYANPRTANAFKLKKMLLDGHIKLNSEPLIKELLTLKFTYDHQQRKILISKEVMRKKYKIASPNMADSIIMAVSLIDNVKLEQETHYYPKQISAPEENLFKIAGIK